MIRRIKKVEDKAKPSLKKSAADLSKEWDDGEVNIIDILRRKGDKHK